MGQFKDQGDAALALAEECAEVIQIIAKMKRFGGDWSDVREGQNKTRWEELQAEMDDVLYQWYKLKDQLMGVPEEIDLATLADQQDEMLRAQ